MNFQGGNLQLTTPNTNDFDTVFPGENWFYYWRTSPSLWESKLRNFQGVRPIFVPINWGLHSDGPSIYDFGDFKPETDLKRLSTIAQNLGIELIYLLPVTPAPYLSNGGMPSYITRHYMIGKDSTIKVVADSNGSLNKLYSFYDPKVFAAYSDFTDKLSVYFREKGVSHQVMGAHSYMMEDNEPISLMEDYSEIFFQGLSRYVKTLGPQNENQNLFKINCSSYNKQIFDLYIAAASEAFKDLWAGVIPFSFIGSDAFDIFLRKSEDGIPPRNLVQQILNSTLYSLVPNSSLLNGEERSPAVKKTISSIVTKTFLENKIGSSIDEEGYEMSFSQVRYFKLVAKDKEDHLLFEDLGLKDFIQGSYPYSFQYITSKDLDYENIDPNMIHFFNLATSDAEDLQNMFRLFMNGAKVLCHTDQVDSALDKKIFSFMLENRIESQIVNFRSTLTRYALGDGEFILFDSDNLYRMDSKKKNEFWKSLFDYMDIAQIVVSGDQDVQYFWQKRSSTSFELNYEEVRRVQLYNPSSYKKKIKLENRSDFAFLKMIDAKDVDLSSTTSGVELVLKPQGSISLDYGYIG